MSIFYAIWADAINYERIKNGGEKYWKTFTFCYMSLLMSLNIATFISILMLLTGYNVALKIKQSITFFSNENSVNFLWAVVTTFIPSMIVNYVFVFYKKKYNSILKNYKFKNGKLLLAYFTISVIGFFLFGALNGK